MKDTILSNIETLLFLTIGFGGFGISITIGIKWAIALFSFFIAASLFILADEQANRIIQKIKEKDKN